MPIAAGELSEHLALVWAGQLLREKRKQKLLVAVCQAAAGSVDCRTYMLTHHDRGLSTLPRHVNEDSVLL